MKCPKCKSLVDVEVTHEMFSIVVCVGCTECEYYASTTIDDTDLEEIN